MKFQAANGLIALDRPGIVALGFDPGLVIYPKPEGDFLELTMADGSRLGVTNARIEQGQVVASTRFAATIRLAFGELVRVYARTASVVLPLGSRGDGLAVRRLRRADAALPPRRQRWTGILSGSPVRLTTAAWVARAGPSWPTAWPPTTGGSRPWSASTTRAGPLGSVVFRVLVDGHERYASPPMSVRDSPRSIDIDVAGAKSIILATEFGERGEVRDLADWVEARLIR